MNKKDLKNKLSEASYIVTQEHGTEAPFSGELLDIKDEGTFSCVCCGNKLFSSSAKYDSGTGWPSFGMFLMKILLVKKLIKVMG